MTIVRYVERNPLRAGLVARAEDWPWSSLGASPATAAVAPTLTPDELLRLGDSPAFVNQPMTQAEVDSIRRSIRRGRPYGSAGWTRGTAAQLGLEFSMNTRGGQRRG